MKLLVYSHFFAPSVGGVETLVLSLARGLAGRRGAGGAAEFAITLVTGTAREGFDDSALPFGVVRRPGLLGLNKLIRGSDVIHVAGPALAPMVLGLLAGKPVVVEHHGFHMICPNGQMLIEPAGVPCPGHFMAGRHGECLRCNSGQGWIASWRLWLLTFVRRFLCRRVAANIAPTVWLGELLQLPRTTAIAHGLEQIAPAAALASAKTGSRAALIAFQGRLVTTKGVTILFEAARILAAQNVAFELLVIGDGPERGNLERIAQQPPLAGRVQFTGRLAGSELDAALAQVAVVVVPSLGGEVFGLVVAENMARGLPVITSDIGAFVEVLGGAGLTFTTGDAADLAGRLSELLRDTQLAGDLGARGRRRALEFCDFARMLDAHVKVYRAIGK